MAKHTPGPWRARGTQIETAIDGQLIPYIVALTGVYTLTTTDQDGVPEANSALIAKAVNNFDAMLAALEAAEPILRAYIPMALFTGHAAEALRLVSAALAQVKGESK